MVRGASLAVVLALAVAGCGSEEPESWSATERFAFVEMCEASLDLPPDVRADMQQLYDLTDDEAAELLPDEELAEEYKETIEDSGTSMGSMCDCLFDGIAERASPSDLERMEGRELVNFMLEAVEELAEECLPG